MFCQEAVMWKHLKHPNILPLLGATIFPRQLISGWVPGGDLSKYIEENPAADPLGLVCAFLAIDIPLSPRSLAIRRREGPRLPSLV